MMMEDDHASNGRSRRGKRGRNGRKGREEEAPKEEVQVGITDHPPPPTATSGDVDAEAYKMHADDVSSDDEESKNTIGRVPLWWYRDYDHIGYNIDGQKIAKKEGLDGIDRYIASKDDPNYRWTIYDEENDETMVLSARDVEIIQRMRTAQFPHPEFDPYPEYNDYYTSIRDPHPLGNDPEPKRRFLPSKHEMRKVMKIVKAMKEGTFRRTKKPDPPETYLLWGEDGMAVGYDAPKKTAPKIPAPKPKPPGHAASYNPPEEYLLTKEEEEEWKKAHPTDRAIEFLPRKFDSLRKVPLYEDGVKERFERCLDLYLCPRSVKKKLSVDPETLLPKLPSPKELRPFPTTQAIVYEGHTGRVRSIDASPSGEWIASGSDDGTVCLWEAESGRQVHCWNLQGETKEKIVHSVRWNPNPRVAMLAVAIGFKIVFINPGTAGPDDLATTYAAFVGAEASGTMEEAGEPEKKAGDLDAKDSDGEEEESDGTDDEEAEKKAGGAFRGKKAEAVWSDSRLKSPTDLELKTGRIFSVTVHAMVQRLSWHAKGDYICSTSTRVSHAGVWIHRLSRRVSQCPLKKNKGLIQDVAFHPFKPIIFVANQRTIRVYDLVSEELVKKLTSGVRWISSVTVHPSGNHIVVGSYDCRVIWFDVEISATPYKTLRYHSKAVRQVVFHPRYPLMATASDDGTMHVFHATVYDDFLKNPLVVPVKIIKGHTVTADGLGTLDACFHPTQPWLFSSGADRTIKLFQNIP